MTPWYYYVDAIGALKLLCERDPPIPGIERDDKPL